MSRTYVSVEEFVAASGIPRSTVSEWCRKGMLRARKIGRRWLIHASELGSTSQVGTDGIQAIEPRNSPLADLAREVIPGNVAVVNDARSLLASMRSRGTDHGGRRKGNLS